MSMNNTQVFESTTEISPLKVWYESYPILYAIQWLESLSQQEQEKLFAVLNVEMLDNDWDAIYVAPRPWIQTPTSSKILESINACWVESDNLRIEKILQYKLPKSKSLQEANAEIVDRMRQVMFTDTKQAWELFKKWNIGQIKHVDLIWWWIEALISFNKNEWFWLNDAQIQHLYNVFKKYWRNPSDLELMCYAQANSEHCRHWTFNSKWIIDWVKQEKTMFEHIKSTHKAQVEDWNRTTTSAYSDNAAVFKWWVWLSLVKDENWVYRKIKWQINDTLKAETHNHPSSISPYPWAATGAWWEIRDEWAVWRWARPKAAFTGFSLSDLRIPNWIRDWEKANWELLKPEHVETPLNILMYWGLWWAAFNNEFGRPNTAWYFRPFEMSVWDKRYWYIKPIMIAWGIWSVLPENEIKINKFQPWTLLVQIGWPWYPVGVWWGSASSQNLWIDGSKLDFASVQRENPEMQRRCQEVINTLANLKENNPILSIHDVWAWWVWNAFTELAESWWTWAIFDLRSVPSGDLTMSPREIWSNEAQERYVLAIWPENYAQLEELCKKERAPIAIVWYATEDKRIIVKDWNDEVMNMTLEDFFKTTIEKEISATRTDIDACLPLEFEKMNLDKSIENVLYHWAVADKTHLITIWNRWVGWMVARDQMVWPWQVPVADVSVTTRDFDSYEWWAMAIWERTPLSITNSQAAARIAIWECITNFLAADIRLAWEIKFSWNWMAAIKDDEEKAKLYDAVEAAAEFVRKIKAAVPVWKDSLSMKTEFTIENVEYSTTAPVSPIISWFAPVNDVRKTLTPELKRNAWETELLLIDLGRWQNRLWWSILAQVWNKYWNETADIDAETLKSFIMFMLEIHEKWLALAYHDRSDGWLYATLTEMSFASHSWLNINLWNLKNDEEVYKALFSEELWAVLQVKNEDKEKVLELAKKYGLIKDTHVLWAPNFEDEQIIFTNNQTAIISRERQELHKIWSDTSYRIESIRDNPVTAHAEYEQTISKQPAMPFHLSFDINKHKAHEIIAKYEAEWLQKPRVAILREQWTNWHEEMAAAFMKAWFEAVDVTMTELLAWKKDLAEYRAMAICWGSSFWDVLWAGRVWAQTILNNEKLCEEFREFFARTNTTTLWVWNWNQMLSYLKELIDNNEDFPVYNTNDDETFKSRYSPVKIWESNSIFLKGMAGSIIPMISANQEWKASHWNWAVMQYVNNEWNVTEKYPSNPNGSPNWATWFTSKDGRITTMMPHPERTFRSVQCPWLPDEYNEEEAPFMQWFYNLREWVENNK